MKTGLVYLLLMGLSGLSTAAAASVPTTLGPQGRLTTSGGSPAPDGDYILTVQMFSQQVGGEPVWKDVPTIANVVAGQFSLDMGKQAPVTPAALAACG